MFVKATTGDYVNLATASRIETVLSAGMWIARVTHGGSSVQLTIDGISELTQADAQSKVRQLVSGIEAVDVL